MNALVTDPSVIVALLLAVIAALFTAARHPRIGKVFKVVPLLVFAYFTPALLSNTGVIPMKSEAYDFIKSTLLPASLVLLTLSVDLRAIARLGRPALMLFGTATAGIVIGGPIAYFLCGSVLGIDGGEQVWRGLAALAGSWIGGGANFVAIGESVGATEATMGLMVVVDVAVANTWMAALLFFADRSKAMDQRIGADASAIDEVQSKIEHFQAEVARPTNLSDLLLIAAIAFGSVAVANAAADVLPPVGDIIRRFTWVVIIVTTIGVGLSFTRLRRLEGAGASAVGSVFLYLLIAVIGAKAEFHRVVEAPALIVVGAVWMAIHATAILLVRRFTRAPIFFAAVGSQANVGGAASAPIVAAAFHPSLATVGVLLGVFGYVLGTYAALVCAQLLQLVHGLL